MSLYVVARPGFAGTNLVVSSERAPSIEREQSETCEALFSALDGRHLVVLGKRWRLGVFSVVELAGRRYVQLSIEGSRQFMLTARLGPATPSRRVVAAVLAWVTHPTASGEILDVD